MPHPEKFIPHPVAEQKTEMSSLQYQFDHPEHMRVGEEDIDVYDLSPETLKTAIATVLAPGFSATPMAHEQNIVGLAKNGRRVISVDSPHGLEQPLVSDLRGEFPEVELAKLSAVMEALDQRAITQADAVAHSEGAIYMLLAAYLYPHRFRNMVLVNPGGMVGKDNVFRLAKGMAAELAGQAVAESKRTDSDRYLSKLTSPLIPLKVLIRNLKRTWSSVKTISESDMVDLLKELKKQGVGISIIHGADDKVFPMERMQKELPKGTVTGFYSVSGGHNEIFIRPEQYTNAIDAALDALEARGNARS